MSIKTKKAETKSKSNGLQRQDLFVQSLKDEKFDFGLVFTQAFLKGIRDIGYKSTATALFENIDNAIQAEAENVHILFDFNKGNTGKGMPDRIAIVDDGYGMHPDMIRAAVLWGGSDRIDDRSGMGKYGYGLPSSCVSIGKKFTVYSMREGGNWNYVPIDIEEIAEGNALYKDGAGRIVAPLAQKGEVPVFVQKYLLKKKITLQHGTIIMIEKIDRTSFYQFAKLKDFLIRQCGVTYRNYLRSTNIFIDELPVDPIDPLFLTEGYRYFDEDSDRAVALPPLNVEVKDREKKEVIGTIKVRFSAMPYTFLRVPEDKEKAKGKNNKRFEIRKENTGVIVLRAGRQIDVVNPNWTTFVMNDRYTGVEIDFPPSLDEEFSVTTSKQQVVVSDRLWDILKDSGLESAIEDIRARYKKMAKEADGVRKANIKAASLAEKVMEKASAEFEVDTEYQPADTKKEAEENFEQEVKKKSEQSGVDEKIVREALQSEVKTRPFRLEFSDEEEAPFYRVRQIGGQVVIYINKSHRFYTDLYNGSESTPMLKNALALLLFVLGHSELRVTKEKKTWYQIERNTWSMKLQAVLETLSEYVEESEEVES